MKIVFAEAPSTANRDFRHERSVIPEDADIKVAVWEESGNNQAFYQEIEDADIIVTGFIRFHREQIEHLKKCKVISFQSTGYNGVDLDFARERGIAVCSVLEYCTQEVSDHAIALMMALQRGICIHNTLIQTKHIWDYATVPDLYRIEGQTLGVMGLGKIGQSVARKAMALGMRIIAYDPYLPPHVAEAMNVKLTELDEVLGESDVITIHMNLTAESEAFFCEEIFKKCRKHPILINVARGGLVSEADLADALDNGLIRGAGLDVLESEYPDLETCRLLGRPNVIITPHAAYYSLTSDEMLSKFSVLNAIACYEGRYQDARVVRNGVGL